jgi:hypothetical protein
MLKNSHIIFLRHGDTNKNQTINLDKYKSKAKKISKEIYDIIKNSNIQNKIIFYSSPEKRCIDTLLLLKENLISKGILNEIKIKINKNLIRWNKKGSEPRQDSKDRAIAYGNKLKNFFDTTNNEFIIYCTHSSIMGYIIEGIHDRNPGRINHGAMFYYNIDDKQFKLENY